MTDTFYEDGIYKSVLAYEKKVEDALSASKPGDLLKDIADDLCDLYLELQNQGVNQNSMVSSIMQRLQTHFGTGDLEKNAFCKPSLFDPTIAEVLVWFLDQSQNRDVEMLLDIMHLTMWTESDADKTTTMRKIRQTSHHRELGDKQLHATIIVEMLPVSQNGVPLQPVEHSRMTSNADARLSPMWLRPCW